MAPKINKNLNIGKIPSSPSTKSIKDKKLAANPVHHLFGYYYYFIY